MKRFPQSERVCTRTSHSHAVVSTLICGHAGALSSFNPAKEARSPPRGKSSKASHAQGQ